MSIWWSLHLRCEAASVPLARRLLLGAMESAGVDPDVSYDLSVALTEACANAVEHGGSAGVRAGGSCGAYRVTAYLDGERCRIEVTDAGPGFPDTGAVFAGGSAGCAGALTRDLPAWQPPPSAGCVDAEAEHGRGLGMIEALADHVDFRNGPGRGAVVSFDKILKWREEAALAPAP